MIPAIIQDAITNKVLMLGYMNEDALAKTRQEGKVCFYSRSKKRLWTKGESSGNFLIVKTILQDCDKDTILIKAEPLGPICHTGSDTCFGEQNGFCLEKLESIIADRKQNPVESSYTTSLFSSGIKKIAQKLGEEAVELVIESTADDPEKFLNESADLLFHFMVLLEEKEFKLKDVVEILAKRNSPS